MSKGKKAKPFQKLQLQQFRFQHLAWDWTLGSIVCFESKYKLEQDKTWVWADPALPTTCPERYFLDKLENFLSRQINWSWKMEKLLGHSPHFCCHSVAKSCPILRHPVDCSTPGSPVLHRLLEFDQIHVHWVTDAILSTHPLPISSPFALNLFQYQGLCHWKGSSYQVVKVLELQLQHWSFQWIFRVDFL